MKGLLRGLVERPHQSQKALFEDWSSEVPLDFKRIDEDIEDSVVDEERCRVSWRGKTGPVWKDDSQGVVEVGDDCEMLARHRAPRH